MRILVIHNRYKHPGGEDRVFEIETKELAARGHVVKRLDVANDDIRGALAFAGTALSAVYNSRARREVASLIKSFGPDIVHVHNFFPKLSPSIFDACAEFKVPAVWTLHNYRMTCANGALFRDGAICTQCLGNTPLPAVQNACYRNSRLGSAAVATMIAWHRGNETWVRKVSRFIALTEFGRDIAIRSGIPSDKIVVKPNVVPAAPRLSRVREGAVFIGRLVPEKGVSTLLEAWKSFQGVPLTIIGDGPELDLLRKIAPQNVAFAGRLSSDQVQYALATAALCVVPSMWYEPFGLTAMEAMAAGTPVVAARIGGLGTLVRNGQTGLLFEAGNVADLARCINEALSDLDRLREIGDAAFEYWRETCKPEANLAQLEAIYENVLAEEGR